MHLKSKTKIEIRITKFKVIVESGFLLISIINIKIAKIITSFLAD